MEFRLQLQVQLSFSKPSKMAIAFFVDPEYGPLPPPAAPAQPIPIRQRPNYVVPNNNRRQPPRQPIVQIDENNNHVIPDLVHGVAHFPQMGQHLPNNEDQRGQRRQRRQLLVAQPVGQESWYSWLHFERFFSSLFNPTISPENESSGDELPDVVQCHRGLYVDLSFESYRRYGTQRTSSAHVTSDVGTPGRRRRHPAGDHPIPLYRNQDPSGNVQEDLDEWNMGLKVGINNSWKAVGADLREIGDQYAVQFESSIQRQRSPSHESFQVRCIFRLTTLPALAIIGVVAGLAYLRRHL